MRAKQIAQWIQELRSGLTDPEKQFIRRHEINVEYPVCIVGIPDLQLALQVRKKLPDMAIILKNTVDPLNN